MHTLMWFKAADFYTKPGLLGDVRQIISGMHLLLNLKKDFH